MNKLERLENLINKNKDYVPLGDFWVLFDASNGLDGSKNYYWWFETREKARSFLKHQKKMKYAAKLVGPFKCGYVL